MGRGIEDLYPSPQIPLATHMIVDIRVVTIIRQRHFVHPPRLLRPVQLDQHIPAVDVGLRVIRPHADGLAVEGVGLFQSAAVPGQEIRQVEEYVQVVGSDPGLVDLARPRAGE